MLKTDRVGGSNADESRALPRCRLGVVRFALGLREELTNGSTAGALHLYVVGVAAIVPRVRRVELGHRDDRKSVHVDRPTSDRGWMSTTSGSSGSGGGIVNVSVTPNTTTAERSGTLTIAGLSVAVRETGVVPCTIDIAPPNASFSSDEATGSFAVSAPGGCEWRRQVPSRGCA